VVEKSAARYIAADGLPKVKRFCDESCIGPVHREPPPACINCASLYADGGPTASMDGRQAAVSLTCLAQSHRINIRRRKNRPFKVLAPKSRP